MNKFNTYGTQALITLSEVDFDFDTSPILSLESPNNTGLWIVLFYDDTPRSERLLQVWNRIAQKMAGVYLASCNILSAPRIPGVFTSLPECHPLYGVTARWPLFVLYEDGYPVGKYRGDYDENEILNWVRAITMLG